MQRFLGKVKRLVLYWFFWVLDYIYIGFWQIWGFFRRGDANMYLKQNYKRQATPIILIPGVYERWEFMKPIAKSLYVAGYDVHVIEGLGYNRGNVEEMARIVTQYADRRDIKNGIIVAHSKGGLIGKYLLAYGNEGQRFLGMVAINTPFEGSAYAAFLPVSSLRIFAPNSPLLLLLAKSTEANKRIMSIYGYFDPHIPGGSFLKGAQNIRLPIYGHFRVVNDSRVHQAVLSAVEKLSNGSYT